MTTLQTATDATTYALAGNATLTLTSAKTGARFTYKIRAKRDEKTNKRDARNASMFFVSLLCGPDNTSDYRYLGLLQHRVEGLAFRTTAKSCAGEDAGSVKAFRYFHQRVLAGGSLPAQLEVRHEGSCGRCGRKLTVPESIDRGIGPECAHHVGVS